MFHFYNSALWKLKLNFKIVFPKGFVINVLGSLSSKEAGKV